MPRWREGCAPLMLFAPLAVRRGRDAGGGGEWRGEMPWREEREKMPGRVTSA